MEGVVQRRPLKDKLRDHWNTRDEIFNPRPQKANKMGVAFSWTYAVTLFYYVINVLLPATEGFREEGRIGYWQLFSWYVFISVLLNWCLTANITGSKVTADMTPEGQSEGQTVTESATLPAWRHCAVCQLAAPPRSHHCKVCNACVLKRDHHCFFTGQCVAWSNQRRFVVFVFHTLIGSSYGVVLISSYLVATGSDWSYQWYNYMPGLSLFSWLFGSMPFQHFVLLLLLYASCIIMFVTGGFLIWELGMILRGQTSYEASVGRQTYRTAPLTGFRSVFGSYGLVHFLVPLPLPLPGDGANWPLYKQEKHS